MKKTKAIAALIGALCFILPYCAHAQDALDFGSADFGSDVSDDFGGASQGAKSAGLSVGGEAKIDFRYYVDSRNSDGDNKSFSDWDTYIKPKGKIELAYEGSKTEADVTFAFNKDVIADYPFDIIDEMTLRAYLGNFVLEGGKMKVVWGKGDKLHVLDNFNANDYTDFIIPDYIDRRISEPMVRLVWNAPKDVGIVNSLRIEGVYAPFMTADRYGSGMWQPAEMSALKASVTAAAEKIISSAPAPQKIQMLSHVNSLANNLYPNLYRLKYGQAGVRATATLGTWDVGLSYYTGRSKKASVNAAKLRSYVETYLKTGNTAEGDKFVDYDRLHIFGAEGAKTFGGFNFRAEAAYTMTNDFSGSDAAIRNHSIGWVFGFDKDLPLSNLNVNVQTIGSCVLNDGGVRDNGAYDVDYNANASYTNDKIVVNISDSWNHEKIKPELSVIWGIEREDLIVMPQITWNVADSFDIIASGLFIHAFDADKSEFPAFRHNSFVQLGMKYRF
ncbi:hypothetical protein H0R94_04030 [Treponema socranskii]|uniref:hypothetical protein n=1 Tax=Treponema socranskii TaxID=53419 RepID=UPI003D8F9B3C